MKNVRLELYERIMNTIDVTYSYMDIYNSYPHFYGEYVFYQAEIHAIKGIGDSPGTTITELAEKAMKTPSAVSKIVRKLIEKGFVEQTRNPDNKREYYLHLTENGWTCYHKHNKIEVDNFLNSCKNLSAFTNEELSLFEQILENINTSFLKDVESACDEFSKIALINKSKPLK